MEVKTFFMPGDLVTLKQDIPHKPIMIVVKKEVSLYIKQIAAQASGKSKQVEPIKQNNNNPK